ncbi:hypothetical protein AVEN_187988-1 [Araneus ventricosus]|uniref:Uncharacterized protein n=1 Tax=Araneus ventricosus TaxID=182803 RepID=A0A4Y2P748_ARAVE|nr:hypothetical protein AVEN_218608-1 [Araneus ventricosus]GBN46882.1 hypothetical protein AVEN_187988-1 [Araneus ventricosus]
MNLRPRALNKGQYGNPEYECSFLYSSDVEFWDDRRNGRTHSYYRMKRNQTLLAANEIQGTRTADSLQQNNFILARKSCTHKNQSHYRCLWGVFSMPIFGDISLFRREMLCKVFYFDDREMLSVIRM